jgi:hypothetical protein
VAAGLFVILAVSAGRGSLAAERADSNELEQVTANMLDTATMSTAMTSFVQKELTARAANTRQAAEVERMFSGFNDRVQSRVALEMRDTILHHIQDLRRQYEDLLRVSLNPEDITALLHFQEDPIFSRLEDHALADSLNTAGSNGADVARQMLAQMPDAAKLVMDEIDRPASVRLGFDQDRRPDPTARLRARRLHTVRPSSR